MVSADTHVTSKDLQNGLFAFIDSEIRRIEGEHAEYFGGTGSYWGSDGRLPDEIVGARRKARMASAEAGYYTMFCPTELGGGGLGARAYFDVWEELCFRYGSPQTQLAFHVLAHTSTGPSALWLYASSSLKEAIIEKLARGELQGSFAMSEPNAGSDAWMMSTRARSEGSTWVLNGTKQWASYSPTADFLLTFAVTDPETYRKRRGGLTCFYVPTDTPGYAMDSLVPTFNEEGSEEAILSFTDLRIPDEYRIGEVDDGFRVAMQGSGQLKLTKMGRTLGLARWSLEKAIEYASVRQTFGTTLINHETIRNMLSASSVDLYAGLCMAREIADRLDTGDDCRFERSMANAFIFEAAYRVYDRSMEVLGGMSLANETRMIAGWHTLRACRISEGSTEIQIRAVGKGLLRGERPR